MLSTWLSALISFSGNVLTVAVSYLVAFVLVGCQEIRPLSSTELDTKLESLTKCQPLPVEKNIVGSWRFESHRFPVGTIRTGKVTFTNQNRIIDPDSLFGNRVNGSASRVYKVIDKFYDTDATGQEFGVSYTGKVFRINLLYTTDIGQGREIWPFYVARNECNKIVIYHAGSYEKPVAEKFGFTLTR